LQFNSTVTPGVPVRGELIGMRSGGSYSFTFACQDQAGNISNSLSTGKYTISITSGSMSTSSKNNKATENKPTTPATPTTTNQCPADQLLTQDLRSGSRDGKYGKYTKAVVTQAHILQAHLNRLGFNSGPTDGILGPLSDGAIKRMQTYLGTKADGYVGPITRNLINNSCGADGLKKQ
jgi:hypothetical protein